MALKITKKRLFNIEKIFYNGELFKKIDYYDNGQKSYEEYFLNNERHRKWGPSYQIWYSNGQKYIESYWENGKLNRKYKPAYQRWFRNGQKEIEVYCSNNKYHREYGPAIKIWNHDGKKIFETYWINDRELNKNEFILYQRKKKIKILNNDNISV